MISTTIILFSVVAMAVFYALYRTLFSQLTFFQLNRCLILIGVVITAFAPIISSSIIDSIGAFENLVIIELEEIVVNSGYQQASGFLTNMGEPLFIIYLLGAGICFARLLVGFIGVMNLIRGSGRYEEFGESVLKSGSTDVGISFFKWIILPESLDKKTSEFVLKHELVHAQQGHSLDRLFMEVICSILWFNPFVWLFRKELIKVHEFIADGKTLQTVDHHQYQLSLLNLATNGNDQFGVTANTFLNPSITKSRFDMMNKTKTRTAMILKYLIVFPLAALLLSVSSALTADVKAQAKEEALANVAKMPEFPGGKKALFQYMIDNIKYPKDAEAEGVEGKVFIKFVVSETGDITKVEVAHKVHPSLDKQALNVVSSMPKWEPGIENNGKAVSVEMVLPISYVLDAQKDVEFPSKKNELINIWIEGAL